jgi:hypothetical protein
VASAQTSITIEADAPMVDSQSGTVRQVVGEQYIQDLPLEGRNAASLFAVVNTSGSLAGFAAGPVMGYTITLCGQYFGSGEPSDPVGWTALFVMIGVVYIASALSWLFIDCTKSVDADSAVVG